MLTRRDRLLEEAVLHRSEDHLAGDWPLFDNGCLLKGGHQRQAAHALVLEQIPRAEAYARLARTADHLDGDDRVAAQFEEIVFQADLRRAKHITPDRRQGFLQVIFRRDIGLLWGGVRQWQGFAVKLAVGSHRQLVQGHHVGGHHVFRQAAEQPGLEVARRCAFQH
ncbi:hypothetical protein [Pseudomonas sp. 52 E 6]|nr:hypothetical protein [Pseudomonas sp. 52 E 6]